MIARTAEAAAPSRSTARIRADDVRLALATAKLRRHTRRHCSTFAAYSQAPLIDADCHHGRPPSDEQLGQSYRTAGRGVTVGPISRGYVCNVFERTRLLHGLDEVRRTWGTGIRALRAEPRYILRIGSPA
ncbi:MAG: hypothetical protein IPM99_18980 [Rubrivivax sp.]|nr:hypothetical protein [Rubrivivax sp.]